MVLEEIGKIEVQLTDGAITIEITPKEFQYFWRQTQEGTASLQSGIHYGHYKTAAYSDCFSSFFGQEDYLNLEDRVSPNRWGYGLTVMLMKIAGITFVNKL